MLITSNTNTYNTLVVDEISYVSNNTITSSIINQNNTQNNIIDLHYKENSTSDIHNLPYFTNYGGNWWGTYTHNSINFNNGSSIYSTSYKNLSNELITENMIYLDYLSDLTQFNSVSNLSSLINKIETLKILFIVTITDRLNNFKEERLYFEPQYVETELS